MENRSENGRFTRKPQDAGSEPPTSGSVVDRARTALEEVLDAAIASKNHDRILEASKLLANFRRSSSDEEIDPFRERVDFVIRQMTEEERAELGALLLRTHALYAAVGMRLGLSPMFGATLSPDRQIQILEAARGRLA